jgi:4-amino-4-deoxy-L-arabinose transferase-like glycosyltransferase
MEEPAVREPAQGRSSFSRLDLALLVLLALTAAAIRFWLVAHTEVAARDSIGYIRYALQLRNDPLPDVLKHNMQHPGYPAWLLAVSVPVCQALGGVTPDSMRLSAQLASVLSAVLLVLPMYFLGRELFHRAAGFWATALFQCLPVGSRVLADALSESTFLLLVVTAMLCAVHAFRTRSPLRFGLCGALAGLAYLTRPEGMLLVPAIGLVLLGVRSQIPWRRTLACGTALVGAAAVVAGPYVATIGHVTNKPTPQEILKVGRAAPAPSSAARAPLACVFAEWAQNTDRGSWLWGLRALLTEIAKGFSYVLWVPALAGLWGFRDRLRAVPGAWVPLLVSLLQGLILWRMAIRMGYVSERHVLLLVLCGLYWAAAGLWSLGYALTARWQRLRPGRRWLVAEVPALALLLVASPCVLALAEGLRPLHHNRAGFHAAGLWLARNAHPADEIVDPFCWAHYSAGRVFLEGTKPERPPRQPAKCYVVVERTAPATTRVEQRKKLERLFSIHIERADHEHSRLPIIPEDQIQAVHGQVVFHWPETAPEEQAKVLVYAITLP